MTFSDIEQSENLNQSLTVNNHISNCIICYRYRNAARLYCVLDFFFNFVYLYLFSNLLYFLILLMNLIGYHGTKNYNKISTRVFIIYLTISCLFKTVFSIYYFINNCDNILHNNLIIPFVSVNILGILMYSVVLKIFMKFYITSTEEVVYTLKNNKENINHIDSYTIVYW